MPRPFLRSALALSVAAIVSASCAGDDGSILGVAAADDPLPRLAGETLRGDRIDATTYAAGRVLVINVWAHDCAPCRQEQPMLTELADRYRDVRFLGINYDDDLDAARAWIREFDVSYPSLFDPAGRTAATLGYPALPDTYVVDRDGTIRWLVFGATDREELTGLIDDVLT